MLYIYVTKAIELRHFMRQVVCVETDTYITVSKTAVICVLKVSGFVCG